MLSKVFKILLSLFASMVTLVLVLVCGLAVWTMTGEKSLTKVVPLIEDALNTENAPYRIHVGDAVLAWEKRKKQAPFDFWLKDITIQTVKGDTLLAFPRISVGIDFVALLQMKLQARSLVFRDVEVRVYREEDNSFSLGLGKTQNQRLPFSVFASNAQEKNAENATEATVISLLPETIQRIKIQHASFKLFDKDDKELLRASDLNLKITRRGEYTKGLFNMRLNYGGMDSLLTADIQQQTNVGTIVAQAKLQQFNPQILGDVFPQYPMLKTMNMNSAATANLIMEKNGAVPQVQFSLNGKDGVFTEAENFAEPIHINTLTMSGIVLDDAKLLRLQKATIQFDDKAELSVKGNITREEQGLAFDMHAEAENMPVNHLYKYWPKTLSPTSYQWVTSHIREGVVPFAEAHVERKPEDIGKPMPEEALAATVKAQGVSVEYLPEHPKVENVTGVVSFTGKKMEITSQQGTMLSGGRLKDAFLVIPDLHAHPAPMQIKLAVAAPASDVVRYLDIPSLNFAKPLGLNADAIKGSAEGKLDFDFVLPSRDLEDHSPHLKIQIDADVKEASQPKFLGFMDISKTDGKLNITHEGIRYAGDMSVSNHPPLKVDLQHTFHDEAGEPHTDYHIAGDMPASELEAFGVPPLPFLNGVMSVKADLSHHKTENKIKARAELTALGAEIPLFSLKKMAGTPATLTMDATLKEDSFAIHQFSLDGEGMKAQGSVSFKNHMQELDELNLQHVTIGLNRFDSLVVKDQNGMRQITGKGESIDLSPWMESDAEKQIGPVKPKASSWPFAFTLDAAFDHVQFAKEQNFKHVKVTSDCQPAFCKNVQLSAKADNADVALGLRTGAEGKRHLLVTASDAGDFLRSQKLYENLQGGVLRIEGDFDDSRSDHPLKGILTISEHKVVKAPLLAQLASLLSLGGIADAVKGDGITFDETDGHFILTDDEIIIEKAKTIGAAMGITVDNGWIDRKGKQVKIEGTVVPSYTLNTALDNIPLVGSLLTGGKGKGIFAASYTVSGSYPDETKLSVNPLSMLAPGFLRKAFGIGWENKRTLQQDKIPPQTSTGSPAVSKDDNSTNPVTPAKN